MMMIRSASRRVSALTRFAFPGYVAAAGIMCGLLGCAPGGALLEAPAKATAGLTEARRVSLPGMPLRGYGELAGDFVLYDTQSGAKCSLLAIQCENEEKAKIVHAKYLSDLHALLPVKDDSLSVAGAAVPVVSVPDQGVVAAFRKGTRVCVAAGTDAASLALVLGTQSGAFEGAEFVPRGTVPMYLDSWDKFGFRFYYRPGETPPPKPGEKRVEWKAYNVLGEFDFAKKNNNCGFVFWQNEDQCDFAEGMRNNKDWEYGARACANRGLPVVVNSSAASPTWLVNRFRDQTQWKMPSYCGGYYCPCDAHHAGNRQIAWSADEALDATLSNLQKTWRVYSKLPTTIEYLEPHGELRHGDHDILNEYGPQADKTFRAFLKETYSDLSTLSQRWFGTSDALKSWDGVRVPELATFLGYSDKALDLGGEWRIQYEEFKDGKAPPCNPAPEEWYLPSCPDAEWPLVTAPHSDITMFLPRRPAVWRRHFAVPAEWRADKSKVWLYIFSLNRSNKETAPVYLNGKKIATPIIDNNGMRPVVIEVSDTLQVGDNLLALRLPANFLGYRVYLTGTAPAQYPFLGEQLNAQWADFIRWHARIRTDTLRRSFEAIREVEPDRSVVCMAPDAFISQVEEICQDYGGHFHNTGYMGGWWAEPLPMMMRAADMPFSVEPGNPGHNLAEFKSGIGHWLTEGVNAIHYFIHVGDVYWNDEIRTWFEENQAIIGALGKMHVPKAEVAMLYGDDVNNLTGWPWSGSHSGYVPCQFNVALHKEYHMDGVSIKDFARGFAAGYRVILDTNTCIMDAKTVDDIEGWIKEGGVFVALGETGRHTSVKADSWPISRLTGYKTVKIKTHPEWQEIQFSEGQTMFQAEAWDKNALKSIGQELEPVDPACVPLALWPNGKVAIGMRKIGKGMIIDIGCNYNKAPLLRQILASLKITQIQGYCDNEKILSTHEISNNSLYDIWIMWNREQKENSTDLLFRDGFKPIYCIDLKTKEKLVPVVDGGVARISDLRFGPGDIRIFAAPRQQIASAPLDWLSLQRGWWRGTKRPSHKIPAYEPRFALELNDQWLMKPLDDKDAADHSAMAAPEFDDAGWSQTRLGCWLIPEDLPTHRIFFRKKFTVPKRWDNGEIDLWLKSWQSDPVMGKARVWLDGAEVLKDANPQDLTAQLKPGNEHLLAIELNGEQRQIIGFRGNFWLAYIPKPDATLSLAGAWTASPDCLTWDKETKLPGPFEKLAMVKRRIMIDTEAAGKNVVFWMDAPNLGEIIVNGHYVRRHHHRIGTRTSLNITPWIKFGEENEFIIPCGGADPKIGIKELDLRFFTPGVYP